MTAHTARHTAQCALKNPIENLHTSRNPKTYITALVQTPRTDDVPAGGIGSSVLFTEDSALGPEPLIWNSPPKRPGMNGLDHRSKASSPSPFSLLAAGAASRRRAGSACQGKAAAGLGPWVKERGLIAVSVS